MTGWVLIAILGVAALLGVVFAVLYKYRKNEYFNNGTDYRALFWMGLVWILFGFPMFLFGNYSLSGLFGIGVVFFIAGLANRDKWGRREKLSKKEQSRKVIALAAGMVALGLGIIVLLLFLR